MIQVYDAVSCGGDGVARVSIPAIELRAVKAPVSNLSTSTAVYVHVRDRVSKEDSYHIYGFPFYVWRVRANTQLSPPTLVEWL